MPVRNLFFLCILGVCLVTGCSTSKEATETSDETHANLRTSVEVENRSLHDLNIFAYYSNQRFRLGNVRSNTTRKLTIPKIISETGGVVLFVADGVGVPNNSLPFYRQELFVTYGETVRFFIPSI